ncbi:phosphoserine phosphatase RsbU/P [Thermotomaculum hydrothermale]|uniref:Phosphoserine phosphatase RsbU/P n=1 Tax=Thermotomaculum hydrothermale TaxID=981385 RepID=A0A7R6SZL7_9BACT|nr:SpoIIE family protein phosphatase [Thermotomaculum hydrothermale]BBB32882.1 phosphoserine phosphatase RsbU/P [Thermotomaculum hydrothermale]
MKNDFSIDFFKKIIEELPMPLFVTDLEDTILLANRFARALMGEDIKGKNANEFIYSIAEKKMVDRRVKERIEKGKEIDTYTITLENKKTGNVFVAELFIHVYKDYKIVLFKDITKEAEATRLINYMETNLKNIQESLLPEESKDFGCLEYAYFYLPYGMIGGDYFDVIKLSDKRLVAIMADISGHFSPSAMVMAIVRTLFHSKKIAGQGKKFVKFIEFLDSYLMNLKNISNYVSGVFCRIDLTERKMHYINAGHLPFIYNNEIVYPVKSQFPVGLKIPFDKAYKEETINLRKGDRFVFFTDGLLTIPAYRERNFREVLEEIRDLVYRYWNYPASECLKNIVSDLNLVNDLPQSLKNEDDLTISVIDIKE